MQPLGAIEPGINDAAGKPEWIDLIGLHPQLSPIPDKQGINPFTKDPMLYKASPDTARVLEGRNEVGMIHWAMDDSRRLAVWSATGAESHVAAVAEDVAARLGWRYVREYAA